MLAVGVAIHAAAAPLGVWDWGPFYYCAPLPNSGRVERVAGPFGEWRRTSTSTFWAVRPFVAREETEEGRIEGDIAWPLGEFSRRPPEHGWRFLTVWYRCFDTSAYQPRWRLWMLPIYIQGRSASGHSYAGLFPFGGRIEEFFGLDECTFVMWPIWSKQRDGNLETTAWFFPIWSRTYGPTESRLRIFPFYGHAKRHGQYEKRFVMWPIWTWARYRYPISYGTGWILFPLYGRLELSDQTSHLILPPFIRIAYGQEVNQFDVPWPFIRIQTGRRNRFHLWPLFGRTTDAAIDRSYAVWPIVWRLRVARADETIRSWHIVPVVHWRTSTPRAGTAPPHHSGRVWPLVGWRREGDTLNWRAPELWPTWDLSAIERSWSPIWTLMRWHKTSDSFEWELLWGLVRHRRDPELRHTSIFPLWERSAISTTASSSWSLLKGLISVRREADTRSLRLLYALEIPLGGHRPSSCTNLITLSHR